VRLFAVPRGSSRSAWCADGLSRPAAQEPPGRAW